MSSNWIDKYEASNLTGFKPASLKKFRLDGRLIEGLHWQAVGTRKTLYNRILLKDWMTNFNDPAAHQRFIDSYLQGLEAQRKQVAKGNFALAA